MNSTPATAMFVRKTDSRTAAAVAFSDFAFPDFPLYIRFLRLVFVYFRHIICFDFLAYFGRLLF
jgi:hypothetical protein